MERSTHQTSKCSSFTSCHNITSHVTYNTYVRNAKYVCFVVISQEVATGRISIFVIVVCKYTRKVHYKDHNTINLMVNLAVVRFKAFCLALFHGVTTLHSEV